MPQLIEVGLLSVAGAVHRSESAIVLRNVSVSTAAIISVHYRFGVNLREIARWLILLNDKGA